MPSILFWNIQRAGAGARSDTSENLDDDLTQLTRQYSPDLVVICEALKGLQKFLKGTNIPGYEVVKPVKVHGSYSSSTTLRYVVLQRTSYGARTYLIDSGANRPALLICGPGYSAIALHAPSVSSSVTPQTNQMKAANDYVVQNNPGTMVNPPCMIFGDLNINAGDLAKVNKTLTKLAGSSLGNFHIRDSGCATHKKGGTLDWALCQQGFNPTVQAVDPQISGSKKRKKKWTDDDEEWGGEYEGVKGADHSPIVISWR